MRWDELEARRDRFVFACLVACMTVILGGYFVVQKTRHDRDIARATERIADALERSSPPRSGAEVCK